MTVEAKIRNLLETSQGTKKLNEYSAGDTSRLKQGSSQDATYTDAGDIENEKPEVNVSKDNSRAAKASTSGDTSRPKQGNSQDASYEDTEGYTAGKKASSKMTKDTSIKPTLKGDTTNDMQGSSMKANYTEDEEFEDDEYIEELSKKTLGSYINKAARSRKDLGVEAYKADKAAQEIDNHTSGHGKEVRDAAYNIKSALRRKESKLIDKDFARADGIRRAVRKLTKEDIQAIFGQDISEEIQEKVTEIFEAAVIARVNEEMISIEEQLIEGYEIELENAIEEHTKYLSEKADSYMNYIADKWLEDNKVQIESNLKLQTMENFMEELKNLFIENNIEIPEEKIDVVEDLQNKINDLEDRLNEEITKNVESQNLIAEACRLSIVDEITKGLADTEIDKFNKLIEGIEFDDEDTYAEKLSVIRKNHFRKLDESSSNELSNDNIITETSNNDIVKYKQAISRAVRK